MSDRTVNININYKVNTTEVVNAQKASLEAQKATDKLKGSTDQVTKSFKDAGETGAKSFTKIGQVVTGLVAAGLFTALTKEVVRLSSEAQKAGAVLQNALGSRSAAQQAIRDLTDFAAKTPFQITTLTAAYVKLVNQGFKPSIAEMRKLGDLASSTGKDFSQLVESVLDAQTGEFERLKEFGIKTRRQGDDIKFTFKGVETQVKNNSAAIRNYILSLGDLNGVTGSMAAISATTGGKLSNIQDNLDQILTTLGNSSSGVINAFLDLANKALGSVNNKLTDQVGALKNESVELNVLVGAITGVNVTEEVRSKLIEELNSKYPDFLKHLNTEKVTNEQLQGRLKDVNDQFLRKIALQTAEERFKDVQEDILDLIDKEVASRKRLNEIREGKITFKGTNPKGGAEGLSPEQERKQEESRINRDIKETQEERVKIQTDLTNTLNEYNSALDLFNKTNNDYFKTENKVTEATNSNTKALKNKKEKLTEIQEYLGYLSELELYQSKKLLEDQKELRDKDAADKKKKLDDHMSDLEAEQKAELDLAERTYEEKKKQREKDADDEKKLKKEIIDVGAAILKDQINSVLQTDLSGYDIRIQAAKDFYEKQISIAGNNEEAKKALRLKEDNEIKNLERQRAERAKRNAIASILVNTAISVAKTAAELGYPAALPFIAIALAEGASQFAIASRARYYAKGAINIKGPGSETSDSIPAYLSKGESVMTAEETRRSMGILTNIRAGKMNDKILKQISGSGGSMSFDDGRIVDILQKIEAKRNPDLVREGRQMYEYIEDKKGFKKKVRSKSI